MDRGTQTDFTGDFARALGGAIGWWREAGVDCAFGDEPLEWLGETAENPAASPKAAMPAATPALPAAAQMLAAIGGAPDTWPADLATFQHWWLSESSLDEGQVHARIPPRGPMAAGLMVLVPHPESEDADQLLSGPQGRLLSAMLAAMGLAEDEVYVASCLARHTPVADWAGLADAGLGAVQRHHIALVGPGRLIAMGGNVLALLGHDPAQKAGVLLSINQDPVNQAETGIPTLAAPDLGALLKRPAGKARLWQDWLEWTARG